MRKLIIGLFVLLAIVIGTLAYAIANVNGVLEQNRERLAALASDAVGREVQFTKAEVAYSGGLAVKIDGVQVAEDPRYGAGSFLELDSAFVGVDLWPALQRRIEVTDVRLDQPTIRVVQTASGFNFSTLGASGEGSAGATSGDAVPAAEGQDLALAVAAFEISNGTVLYEDRTANPPLALTIVDFESSGTDLALENRSPSSSRASPSRPAATRGSRAASRARSRSRISRPRRAVYISRALLSTRS